MSTVGKVWEVVVDSSKERTSTYANKVDKSDDLNIFANRKPGGEDLQAEGSCQQPPCNKVVHTLRHPAFKLVVTIFDL